MSDAPKPEPQRHSRFFDLELDPKRAELTRPSSMLRTTEWGGLTLLSILAGLAFPPYFMTVLWVAFFNAGGLLWVMHLSESGRQRLRQFEREFAQGHALEEAGDFRGAVAAYEALVPAYKDVAKIAEIAQRRIEFLKKEQSSAFETPSKTPPKPRSAAKAKRRK